MTFFDLTHPHYETDYAEELANPIQIVEDVRLPGLICSKCGETWAGDRRLYFPIEDAHLLQRLSGPPLPELEWSKLVADVRANLGLPADFALMPGDILGVPTAELMHNEIPDLVHPFPGQIVVRSAVVDTLRRAEVTGWRPVRLNVRWSKRIRQPGIEPPELYELLVTDHMWREGVDQASITVCEHCGRTIFPAWRPITESRWDGSDFFNVDNNPNMVFVTERVCILLEKEKFTNWVCIPVE